MRRAPTRGWADERLPQRGDDWTLVQGRYRPARRSYRDMMDTLLLLAMNGLIWGLIIALIALGLSVIFGLLDIINIAHGDFFMVGTVIAWFTLEVDRKLLARLYRSTPHRIHSRRADPERGDSAHARRCRIVDCRNVWPVADPAGKRSHHFRSDAAPHSAADHMAQCRCSASNTMFTGCLRPPCRSRALVGFFLFLQHTKIGTWMRAVRHDRDTAIAMGIPAQRIYILTFGIGFALAALAARLRRRLRPSISVAASISCRSASWP